MIQLEFTEAEIDALNYERYHHPHPGYDGKWKHCG